MGPKKKRKRASATAPFLKVPQVIPLEQKAVPAGSVQVHLVTGALLVHGHNPAEAAITLAGDIGYVHATDAVAGAYAGQYQENIIWGRHQNMTEHVWQTCTRDKPNVIFCM